MNAELVFGGRPLPRALDDIRRYCGLGWSGGLPEVFAFPYFDALAERREDETIRAVDVLAASVLHPALRKRDLAYFVDRQAPLDRELEALPPGVDLADVADAVVDRLATLGARLQPACGLSLLTKVLHAKRPRLVPIFDRALTDCYRHSTGGRGESSWAEWVGLFREDLRNPRNRETLSSYELELRAELGSSVPTQLRLADIAIWNAAGAR